MTRQRIISLLPAATEMVCALGLGDQLVGRSHQCDFPPEILPRAICTRSTLHSDRPGAAIDREVKSRLHRALSLYEIDVEKVRELRPDFILTQTQCEVCAVSLSEVERALSESLNLQPKIISLAPATLADVWQTMAAVADELGVPEDGLRLIRRLKGRVVDVIEKTCLLENRATVVCIEWIDPLMAAGNWVPELVDLAGGKNLIGQVGKHSPWMPWEQLIAGDPDVIVAMPCGFDLARAKLEMAPLSGKPEWNRLRAVKNGRVYLTDGNQFFNRPGPRLVESLQILAEILHPKLFQFAHRGTGWEKY